MPTVFTRVELPRDDQRLVEFLCHDEWPFHGRRRLTANDVAAIDFSSADVACFWIIEQHQTVGLIRLLDLGDIGQGAPLFDVRITGEHRGRGLGTRAAGWIVDHLFTEYPELHRIEATTRHDNTAMRRVLEGAGFAHEGRLRNAWWSDDGNWFDAMIYGALRSEWSRPAYSSPMVDASHVRRTAAACTTFLLDHVDRDWTGRVPDLEMSVVEVVAHAAEGCLWYAIDLAAAGEDVDPVEHRVKVDGDSSAVVATLRTYADVVASVVGSAPASARGFHPLGTADPSGFAAMACDEMLIHTDDAARGLGVAFEPSPDLVEPVLRRLFPWVTVGPDPWSQLRWANGRIAFDGLPRQSGWAWYCAPIENWDGTVAIHPQSNTDAD